MDDRTPKGGPGGRGALRRVRRVDDAAAMIPTTGSGRDEPPVVRVKSLAVIVHPSRRRHLVFRARERTGDEFHRPLGGTVEPGERSIDTAVREIREEIGATFVPEALLGVVENIFEVDGRLGHEIDFLYVGSVTDPDSVPDHGRTFDDGGAPGWAEWRSITEPPADVALHPDELHDLLTRWLDRPA